MDSTKTEMRRSWLIQRLNEPMGGESILGKDNPFAFGGGLHNGGLSPEALDLLRPIFSFDYMGSPEFEFGAVPKALSAMAKAHLVAEVIVIRLADVAPSWRQRKAPTPDGDAGVYLLCPTEMRDEVESRVRQWASEDFNEMKEQTHLNTALRPQDKWDVHVQGWLELDNGFMFFTSREMWAATSAVFGLAVPA